MFTFQTCTVAFTWCVLWHLAGNNFTLFLVNFVRNMCSGITISDAVRQADFGQFVLQSHLLWPGVANKMLKSIKHKCWFGFYQNTTNFTYGRFVHKKKWIGIEFRIHSHPITHSLLWCLLPTQTWFHVIRIRNLMHWVNLTSERLVWGVLTKMVSNFPWKVYVAGRNTSINLFVAWWIKMGKCL